MDPIAEIPQPLDYGIEGDRVAYSHVDVEVDRARGLVTITVRGPTQAVPVSVEAAHALGDKFWPLTVAREPATIVDAIPKPLCWAVLSVSAVILIIQIWNYFL